MDLKYKVGDRVKVKSLDWYNENKTIHGSILLGNAIFGSRQSLYCGCELTIRFVINDRYYVIENDYYWTDEMIECKVEEKTKFGTALNTLEIKSNANCLTQEKVDETKPEPKFKVGDRVITDTNMKGKIIEVVEEGWYRVEFEPYNDIPQPNGVVPEEHMSLVEEEVGLIDGFSSRWVNEFNLPDGYIFKDENGNEIHTTKIVLEKANTLKIQSNNMETETHRGYCTTEEETTNKSKKVAWFTFEDNDFADKVELALSNRELIQEDGKWFVVKKKKEYPKNYEECCKILGVDPDNYLTIRNVHCYDGEEELVKYESNLLDKFHSLWKLRICRDAYWKIYGDEMRLGKPWEPDWNNISDKYCIYFVSGHTWSKECQTRQCPFAFPTPEMRDVFNENFDADIEICKELL